jgi:hypothetical protein
MSNQKRRFYLLGGCLVLAAFAALVIHQPGLRLIVCGALLVAAALSVLVTSESRQSGSTEPKPAEPATPAKPSRQLLPKRKPSPLLLIIDALRQQLEAHELVISELSIKLGHNDGLRTAMWNNLDRRMSEVEATQQNELVALREARERHQLTVVKLQESVEAHNREMAALSEVLHVPETTQGELSSHAASAASSF